jgi:opacity protein-like surface antigen
MKTPRTSLALSLAAIAALFATPVAAAAAEEEVVPPGNSAAAQYTEAFPTSGGDKKTDETTHHRSPSKVLGSHNTKKLETQGPEGKAAAEAAAATAPASVASTPSANTPSSQANSGGGHNSGGGGGPSKDGNGGESAPQQAGDTAGSPATVHHPPVPAGSSGLGAAIGQATGLSTTAGSGPLLPLVILATVLWSLAYLWRQRRQVD